MGVLKLLIFILTSSLNAKYVDRYENSSISKFSFQRYERYGTMISYLNSLQQKNPEIINLLKIGETYQGRNIYVAHISKSNSIFTNKPAILIDGGIHAREWISSVMTMYIIRELVENYKKYSNFLDKLDIFVIPVLNPDGYEYSHTKDRRWRKNRSKIKGSRCVGVDLNRNFNVNWSSIGDPCSDTFSGYKPFSENESKALRDFGLLFHKKIKLYLTLHCYGPLLLHPFGYKKELPKNMESLISLGQKAVRNLKADYEIGSAGRLLYVAPGGSDDWFFEKIGVPFVYTMELPPGDEYKFHISEDKILEVVQDTWKAIFQFINAIQQKF